MLEGVDRPAFGRMPRSFSPAKQPRRVVVPACLRPIATRRFEVCGDGPYAPRALMLRPLVALRGGDDGLVLAFRVDKRAVEVRVLARGACTEEDTEQAFELARGIAAVDDDPSAFIASLSRAPDLAALAKRHDVRIARSPTIFESLAPAILEQLVTTYEARAAWRRLHALAGETVTGTDLRAPPTAARVRALPMWKLHEIGIGAKRAVTLHLASRRGDAIERLRALAPEVALEKLMSLKGVGPWTANLVVRNAFGYADAVPVGDLHAPRLVTEALTGAAEGDDASMLAALEPYRPHRARVAILVESMAMARRTGPLPRVDRHRRMPWKY